MDVSFFTGISRRLPNPKDARLSYGSMVAPRFVRHPDGQVRQAGSVVAVLLHGPAGTVDLMWTKVSDRAESIARQHIPGSKWYELASLSLGWHSRSDVPDAECHNEDCDVLRSGPFGGGACWHSWSYCDGLELAPVIDAGAWVTLGEKLERYYRVSVAHDRTWRY